MAVHRRSVSSLRLVARRLLAAGAVAGVLAAGAGSAAAIGGGAPVVVDDFTVNQPQIVASAPPVDNASNRATGSAILGGDRENTVEATAGNATLEVEDGRLTFTQDTPASALARVVWDGPGGGDTVDPALAGVDLTNGGTQDAIRVRVGTNQEPILGRIRLTTGANVSPASLTLPVTATPADLVVPFEDFLADTPTAPPART